MISIENYVELTLKYESASYNSRIVELRFFGGLSVAETAEVLKSSERTVAREWELAKSWLYRQLSNDLSQGAG